MGILNTSKIEYVCYTSSSYSDMNYVRKRSHFSLFKFISKPTWNANGKMLVDCLIIFRRLSNASNGQTCKFAPLETLLRLAMCILQYKKYTKNINSKALVQCSFIITLAYFASLVYMELARRKSRLNVWFWYNENKNGHCIYFCYTRHLICQPLYG